MKSLLRTLTMLIALVASGLALVTVAPAPPAAADVRLFAQGSLAVDGGTSYCWWSNSGLQVEASWVRRFDLGKLNITGPFTPQLVKFGVGWAVPAPEQPIVIVRVRVYSYPADAATVTREEARAFRLRRDARRGQPVRHRPRSGREGGLRISVARSRHRGRRRRGLLQASGGRTALHSRDQLRPGDHTRVRAPGRMRVAGVRRPQAEREHRHRHGGRRQQGVRPRRRRRHRHSRPGPVPGPCRACGRRLCRVSRAQAAGDCELRPAQR